LIADYFLHHNMIKSRLTSMRRTDIRQPESIMSAIISRYLASKLPTDRQTDTPTHAHAQTRQLTIRVV